MILGFIIGISVLAIIMHVVLNAYGKTRPVEVNVKKELEKVIEDYKMNTLVKEGSSLKPCYDYDKDQVEIREGQTTKHLAEGFHELGHAIDAYKKNSLEKEYGILSGILFYIMKYSLPLAIFFHSIVAGAKIDHIGLVIFTYVLIGLSVFFTTVTLLEEIKATSYAKKEIKKRLTLNKEQLSRINATFLGGMTSYITLFILSYTTLGFQLFYNFFGIYM